MICNGINNRQISQTLVSPLTSWSIRRKTRKLNVNYSFLFTRAEGSQLTELTRLIEASAIKPVLDKVFPFEQANEALSYAEGGYAKEKVVIKVK